MKKLFIQHVAQLAKIFYSLNFSNSSLTISISRASVGFGVGFCCKSKVIGYKFGQKMRKKFSEICKKKDFYGEFSCFFASNRVVQLQIRYHQTSFQAQITLEIHFSRKNIAFFENRL